MWVGGVGLIVVVMSFGLVGKREPLVCPAFPLWGPGRDASAVAAQPLLTFQGNGFVVWERMQLSGQCVFPGFRSALPSGATRVGR
jgi:hypothetical protein